MEYAVTKMEATSSYLVVEYVMALMVFGREYSLHLNMVAIAYAWMPPCEDSDSTASARVLQFEGRVVVAPTRRSFLQRRD
jgi:hypothetical protein